MLPLFFMLKLKGHCILGWPACDSVCGQQDSTVITAKRENEERSGADKMGIVHQSYYYWWKTLQNNLSSKYIPKATKHRPTVNSCWDTSTGLCDKWTRRCLYDGWMNFPLAWTYYISCSRDPQLLSWFLQFGLAKPEMGTCWESWKNLLHDRVTVTCKNNVSAIMTITTVVNK